MRKSLFSVNISNIKKHIKNYQKNTVSFICGGGCTVGLVSPRTIVSAAVIQWKNHKFLILINNWCFQDGCLSILTYKAMVSSVTKLERLQRAASRAVSNRRLSFRIHLFCSELSPFLRVTLTHFASSS